MRARRGTTSTLSDSAPHGLALLPPPSPRRWPTAVEEITDAELVRRILGCAGDVAAVVAQDLVGLTRIEVVDLLHQHGIGRVRAARLAASIELGRRVLLAASVEPATRMSDHQAVVAWARPRLAALDHEELWVLALDGRNGLRAGLRVASGGIHGLHVGVRDVLRAVIRQAASAFILVHNHPSGDPEPSVEDLAFTAQVADAATLVGTALLDHVIIARQTASSLYELGHISPQGRRRKKG